MSKRSPEKVARATLVELLDAGDRRIIENVGQRMNSMVRDIESLSRFAETALKLPPPEKRKH